MQDFFKKFACLACSVFLLCPPWNTAEAGGFFVRQNSTSAQSSAFAGASARGADPSHLFFNGATIADNPGSAGTVDARLYLPDVEIEADTATSPLMMNILNRGNSGSMADPALAAGLYGSRQISNNLYAGIGISAPFAVVIETDDTWSGQFQLLKTEMTALNVNPVLAYRIRSGIVVSGGLQIQHFDADLRKTELLPLGGPFFAEAEGFLKGDDTALGFTAGLLLKPADTVRFGLGYRSEIKHELNGTAGVKFQGIPVDTASFDVKTPQAVTAGMEIALNDRVALLGEVQWVDWSVFTGFDIGFGSGRPNEVRPQTWQDTWFYSIGARVKLNDHTDVSFGLSMDDGISTSSANTLSPDGDRKGIAFGLTRRISDTAEFRASYMHLFFDDADIDIANQSGTLKATFENDLDIVGFSFTIRR